VGAITLHQHAPVLADAGVETAIVHDYGYQLPELQTIGMLDDRAGRAVLIDLWTRYLGVGRRHGLAMVVGTPTWRGGPDRILAAGRPARDVERLNKLGVELQRNLVADRDLAATTWVAGVLGPRGDGYRAGSAPDVATAARYHQEQATVLAEADADFLFAVPIPTADEGIGVARAMASTGVPYVPSFLVDHRGTLPDGTALSAVQRRLAHEVAVPPLHVSISCVHPRTVLDASACDPPAAEPHPAIEAVQVRELKANGSPLPPAVLDRSSRLECDPPDVWADAMLEAAGRLPLTVLGGCCGTNADHLDALATRLAASSPSRWAASL
jgi:S-methylmethionine-dependent homocysteine/selenocysteine methylase